MYVLSKLMHTYLSQTWIEFIKEYMAYKASNSRIEHVYHIVLNKNLHIYEVKYVLKKTWTRVIYKTNIGIQV